MKKMILKMFVHNPSTIELSFLSSYLFHLQNNIIIFKELSSINLQPQHW